MSSPVEILLGKKLEQVEASIVAGGSKSKPIPMGSVYLVHSFFDHNLTRYRTSVRLEEVYKT